MDVSASSERSASPNKSAKSSGRPTVKSPANASQTSEAPSGFGADVRRMVRVAGPLTAGLVSQLLIFMINLVYVGSLGKIDTAAVGLANSLYALVMFFGLGIFSPLTALLARSFREKDFARLRLRYHVGIGVAYVVSFLVMCFMGVAGWVIAGFGQPTQVVHIAQLYCWGAAPGAFFMTVYLVWRSLATAMAQTSTIIWAMVPVVAVSPLVNGFLIYGVDSFHGLGIFGAGLSVSVSRLFMLVLMVFVVRRREGVREWSLRLFPAQFSRAELGQCLRLGLPNALRSITADGFLTAALFLIGHVYSVQALELHSVALRWENFLSVVAFSVSSASTTLVSYARVEMDAPRIRRAYLVNVSMVAVYGAVVSAVMVGVLPLLLGDFFHLRSPWFEAHIGGFVPLFCLMFLSDMVFNTMGGCLIGLLDTAFITLVSFVGYWVIGSVLIFVTVHYTHLGFEGIWAVLAVVGFVSALAVAARYRVQAARVIGSFTPPAVA